MIRLAVLADLHLPGPNTPPTAWHSEYNFAGVHARLATGFELAADEGCDFICIVGDIVQDDPAPLTRMDALIASSAIPVLVVGGNHDPAPTELRARLPSALFAQPEGGRRSGLLLTGIHARRAPKGPASIIGELPRTHDWGDAPVILLSHFPVLSLRDRLAGNDLRHPGDLDDRPALERRLATRDAPTIVISGHVHARDHATRGTILQIVVGALVEAPYEISILTVSIETTTRVTRRAIRLAAQLPDERSVLVPDQTTWSFDATSRAWTTASP